MKFKDEYTSEKKLETGKTELSNDAYAIGELLEMILHELRKSR